MPMHMMELEPAIPTSQRPQIYALDSAAIAIEIFICKFISIFTLPSLIFLFQIYIFFIKLSS
jgi:hypothetical protein